MTDDELWALLLRHSRNALTADDAARLHAWVDGDATRVDVLRSVDAIAAASREIVVDPDADASWTVLRERLATRTQVRAAVPSIPKAHRPVLRAVVVAPSAWRRRGAASAVRAGGSAARPTTLGVNGHRITARRCETGNAGNQTGGQCGICTSGSRPLRCRR